MVFGHPDADAVYDAIKKALRPMHIRLIRVDRIEHNDDLDDRIIAEIERADFVLADLTYCPAFCLFRPWIGATVDTRYLYRAPRPLQGQTRRS